MTFSTGGAWLLLAAVVLIVEGYAIATHRRTLSRQVWVAIDEAQHPVWHWLLPLLSVLGFGVVFAHFFCGLWN